MSEAKARELFDMPGPHITESSHVGGSLCCEPTLREMLVQYYSEDFPTERAKELAQRYIDAYLAAVPAPPAERMCPKCNDTSYLVEGDVCIRHGPLDAAPAAEPVAQTRETYCWLIERGQPEGQEPTIWWVGPEPRDDEKYLGTWSEDAYKAKRFATRAEGEQYAVGSRGPGHSYRVTDHIFIDRFVEVDDPPECGHCHDVGCPVCGRYPAAPQPEAPTLADDPLVGALRSQTGEWREPLWSVNRRLNAAARIESDAERIRVLEAERERIATHWLDECNRLNADLAASCERERAAYERAAKAVEALRDNENDDEWTITRGMAFQDAVTAIRELAAPDSAALTGAANDR